jgi:hypothetical protein
MGGYWYDVHSRWVEMWLPLDTDHMAGLLSQLN